MKNNKLFPLLIITCIFLSTCNKTDDEFETGNPDFTQMNLENLEVGQEFKFLLFQLPDRAKPDFEYTEDTLVLKVIEKNGSKVRIQESISPFSAMHTATDRYFWSDKDGVYENFWEVRNDSLFISPIQDNSLGNSHLLWGLRRFAINDIGTREVGVDGWRPEVNMGSLEQDVFTTDFTLHGEIFDRLNIKIHDTPMTYDGNGSTYFYSRKHGFVRTASYSAWTAEGQGWDRVE